MIVTRTFEPIVKEVSGCLECPYYSSSPEMSMTISRCDHPKFDNGATGYFAGNIILDIKPWGKPVFSKHCPLIG